MQQYSLVVIGGGPAGMAAALSAHHHGVKDILILERETELGGILKQCVHRGFGEQELTGPEYSARMVQEVFCHKIKIITETTVTKITPSSPHTIHVLSSKHGHIKINTTAIVLAMGCRERARGAVNIHGSRPAGVYTAGTAQQLVNLYGLLPGNNVVILGSGDIGLVMARRMTLGGAQVQAVVEILPYSSGLPKNVEKCLNAFNIPLLLNTTIIQVHGKSRVCGVTLARVNEGLQPLDETKKLLACDTVLLSVGLIPENELSRRAGVILDVHTHGPVIGELRQTNIEGIFACGNVLQIHDTVDRVSNEGRLAGEGVARYIYKNLLPGKTHTVTAGEWINYVMPHHINVDNVTDGVDLLLRTKQAVDSAVIKVMLGDKIVASKHIKKLIPAETVRLILTKQDLVRSNQQELVVKLEKTG